MGSLVKNISILAAAVAASTAEIVLWPRASCLQSVSLISYCIENLRRCTEEILDTEIKQSSNGFPSSSFPDPCILFAPPFFKLDWHCFFMAATLHLAFSGLFTFFFCLFLLPTSLKADCQTFWCEDSYFELSFLLINFCPDRLEETKQGDLLVQVAERDWLAVPSLTPPPRPKHLREPTTRVYQIAKVLNRQSIKIAK